MTSLSGIRYPDPPPPPSRGEASVIPFAGRVVLCLCVWGLALANFGSSGSAAVGLGGSQRADAPLYAHVAGMGVCGLIGAGFLKRGVFL